MARDLGTWILFSNAIFAYLVCILYMKRTPFWRQRLTVHLFLTTLAMGNLFLVLSVANINRWGSSYSPFWFDICRLLAYTQFIPILLWRGKLFEFYTRHNRKKEK